MHDKVPRDRNRQELTLAKHALQVRAVGGEKIPGGIHTWSLSSGMTSLDPGVLRWQWPRDIGLYHRGLLLLEGLVQCSYPNLFSIHLANNSAI